MAEGREEKREIESSDVADELGPSSPPYREDDEKVHLHDLEVIVALAELLEVALHTILYIRQVYPIELFERRVKFGIPVFQCTDRSIHNYISEAIKSISEEITQSSVARVIITVHQSETPLEKFIFSFDYTENNSVKSIGTDIMPLDFVQRQARGMLLKLNAIDAQLLPLDVSDDLSFSFIMQLRGGGAFRISEDSINFDDSRDENEKEANEGSSGVDRIREPALVHIIRSDHLSVYLHVQESEAKGLGKSSKTSKSSGAANPADEE